MSFTGYLSGAAAALLAAVFTTGAAAAAPDWPNAPIRIVVPYSAGGSTDNVSRKLAQELAERLKTTVFVENKIGAMGMIGSGEVARAKADGYTLLANDVGLIMLPHVRRSVPYDAHKDLKPIGAFVFSPFLVAVNADSPYRTLQDLVAKAKSKPDAVTYGSGGVGTSPHLVTELFANKIDAQLYHIPYKGAGEAVLALMSGTIDMQMGTTASLMSQLKSGKLRGLAISGEHRQESLPDVPTFAEAGMKDFGVFHWIGLWAPAQTPPEAIQRLQAALEDAMKDPDMQAFSRGIAAEPKLVVGAELQELIAKEDRTWEDTVARIGLEKQ
ncbi:tripartite tricarboxylate transporter substrate binding protein [Bordetella petrii]|nr:tripartite tricarboxylate transporter substrate binding protein [Bordetella petrii]